MADVLPGSNQVGATITAGATTFTVNTEAPALMKLCQWCVVDPFTVQAEIRRITSHSGSTVTVAVAFTYNHAAGDAIIWMSTPAWDVHLFGAIGNNSTDDTAAIQAAINDAARAAPVGVVQFGPHNYKITSTLTVATDGMHLRGMAGLFRSSIVGYAATACLTVDKGGGSITYQVKLSDIDFNGNGTTATGVKLVNASECTLADCAFISNAGKGLWLNGTYTGIFNGQNLQFNNNPVAIYADGGTAIWFRGCNVYDCDTAAIQLVGTILDLVVSDTWFETFGTGVLVDSAGAHCDIYGVYLRNNYWLNTAGGGSYTGRVVKATAANDTYRNVLRQLEMTGNYFYTTASAYLVEVDWNGYYHGGDNRFWGRMVGNYMHNSTNITSWITSDVTDLTATWVRLDATGNTSYNTVKFTDAPTRPTGGLHRFTAADATPSVAIDAPFYRTANTGATTITMFDDGYPGQVIRVLIQDAYTTLDFTGTNLKGNAGGDWSPTTNDWLEAIFDGTNWYCNVHDCTA